MPEDEFEFEEPELEEFDEDEDEDELELELELVVLLAVGVEDEELSVLDEPVELFVAVEVVVELDVELVPEDELLVCVALGTVAATASEPAIPLAATIAVIVAVRALPCRTERAAPSASMAQLRQGKLSFRDP